MSKKVINKQKLNLTKPIFRNYSYIALAIILCLSFMSGATASSDSTLNYNKKIRVGLKELYETVDTINITNSSLILGYEIDGNPQTEQTFTSTTGFSVVPATGFFLISEQFYKTYDECDAIVKALKDQGHKAYSGNASIGIWKVYIGDAATEVEATAVKNILQSNLGQTYEVVADNGLRTLLKIGAENEVVIENSYIQSSFTTNDLTKGIAAINLGKRSYRGTMEVGRYNKKGVTAINIIGLEEYLYGVVPSEIVSSWPKESLKAQAVAARSFAIYNTYYTNKYPKEAYMICDTVTSQVYKGLTGETVACNVAVNETNNQAVYYDNKVIPAYFFSTSGGHTEDSQNVWSGTVAYLKGKPDLYETEPEKQPWLQAISATEIEAALTKNKVNIGKIVDVQVISYSSAGRAMSLKIIGTTGSHDIPKETMRTWLGLKSRKFTLIKSTDMPPETFNAIGSGSTKAGSYQQAYTINGEMETNQLNMSNNQLIIFSEDNINSLPTVSGQSDTFIFVGQGNGHGVGMSQSGAKGMAQEGFTYKQIIEYYFTGAMVK
ncbi:MAG: hypothetical protein CVU84_01450 [Firmicutes bacterium HGW-Firmicutes-1]|jgi:stage II sporulation protein D|nr:MAG: hypothetical protein CVU84_01450 [Firmicutes bacterium HGW-Firmicutes-1]